MVFKIGDDDFSKNVLAGSYDVSEEDVFAEMKDANSVIHRNIYRTRVSGSFDMFFMTESDCRKFIEAIKLQKLNGGVYICTVAVNNRLDDYTGRFFIDFRPVRNMREDGRHYLERFTVNIEEQ